jgi:hypothetical protein
MIRCHSLGNFQGDSLNADHTVIAEPKHFVGHGSPEGGTNTSPVHNGERELRMVMLRPFELAIREGHAMGVMAAYHEIDGIPIGSREGDEVAQLYIREDVSTVETPRRSLAGFSRIHLKPQETKTVVFRIPPKQLAVWNAEGKWAVEMGNYTAWAGGSSVAP